MRFISRLWSWRTLSHRVDKARRYKSKIKVLVFQVSWTLQNSWFMICQTKRYEGEEGNIRCRGRRWGRLAAKRVNLHLQKCLHPPTVGWLSLLILLTPSRKNYPCSYLLWITQDDNRLKHLRKEARISNAQIREKLAALEVSWSSSAIKTTLIPLNLSFILGGT